MSNIVASVGHYGFWGLSSSVDLVEAYCHAKKLDKLSSSDPFRILLCEPGDIRHVLTLIARRRRNGGISAPIEIYILENTIEVLAREILLLELLFDFEIPIRQRAVIFLEIFGNSKVQERTSRYMEVLGYDLRQYFAHGTGRLENILDLSLLRFRDRDRLEDCFKGYHHNTVFDIDSYRDHRLRGLYGDRYDSRTALADWDYQESLHFTASIIHIKLYKEWRMSGIAMEFGDQKYTEPNRSLISYAEGVLKGGKDRGMKKEVLGYWGDVVCSPYFSFGIDCETTNKHAEGLFEIYNKNTGSEQHRHHCVEVSVFHVLSLLWELETGKIYEMSQAHEVYSGLGNEGFRKTAALKAKTHEEESASPPDLSSNVEEDQNKKDIAIEELIDDEEDENKVKNGDGDSSNSDNNSRNANMDTPSSKNSDKDKNAIPKEKEEEEEERKEEEEEEEEELAKAIQRAECIVESLQGIKILPLMGPASQTLSKAKFQHSFHCVFVSNRSAQWMKEDYFASLLHDSGAMIAAETAKFFVPLPKVEQKDAFEEKLDSMAHHLQLKRIPAPVPRRHRDEQDRRDDVIFFV